MSVLPVPFFPAVPGETAAARICRIVRAYAGASLSVRRADLAALVGRGIDDESIVTWSTNCAVFALGVLFAAGCPSPLLHKSIPNAHEFDAVLVPLGDSFGAWRDPAKDGLPTPGSLGWYRIAGRNVDHVEFELDDGEHGGGGRANNEITVVTGPVAAVAGKPLYKWLDVSAICLPDANATDATQGAAGGSPDTIPIPADAVRETSPPSDPDETRRP